MPTAVLSLLASAIIVALAASWLMALPAETPATEDPSALACEFHGMLCKGKIHSDALSSSRSSACGR